MADLRLSVFSKCPSGIKMFICQPLLEQINIERYLDDVDLVVVGGESDPNARPLNFDWVLSLRQQCLNTHTHFEFRQCGTHFIKDGKNYKLNVAQLCSQAKKAGIDC